MSRTLNTPANRFDVNAPNPAIGAQWTHCVATMRIESIQKGEGLKIGDLIFVQYIGSGRLIGKDPEPGPGPHMMFPLKVKGGRCASSRTRMEDLMSTM